MKTSIKVTINLWGASNEDKERFRHPLLSVTLEAIRTAISDQQADIEIQWGGNRTILYKATPTAQESQ